MIEMTSFRQLPWYDNFPEPWRAYHHKDASHLDANYQACNAILFRQLMEGWGGKGYQSRPVRHSHLAHHPVTCSSVQLSLRSEPLLDYCGVKDTMVYR